MKHGFPKHKSNDFMFDISCNKKSGWYHNHDKTQQIKIFAHKLMNFD